MAEHPIASLSRRLSRFAPKETLASIGALQLMPENVGRAVRLELAACAAAVAKSNGRPRPLSRGTLDGLMNGPELSDPQLASQEDPIGGWFVESLSFVGGAYRVFPGITSNATFILRHLAMAIVLHRAEFSDSEYGPLSRKLFQTVLTLSETIAARAGLARGVLPIEKTGRSRIEIPDETRLEELRRAVTFSQPELDGLLRHCGAEMPSIEPLILESESLESDACNPDSNPLQGSPIVRVDGEFVVANPLGLAAALRHAIVCLAVDSSVSDELASRVCQAALRTTVDSLRLMDINVAGETAFDAPAGLLMADGLFGLDTDKALYACVVSDDLSEYDRNIVFGMRPRVELWPVLRSHLDRVTHALFSSPNAPNEVFVLILMHSIGRFGILGVDEAGEDVPYEVDTLSVSDLEIISHLEQRKNLFLPKFSRACRALREKVQVVSFGRLNEYGFFRDRDYSFHISDDARPTAFFVDSSWEGQLERESLDRVDRHGVLSYDGRHVAEVVLLHGDRNVPIYTQLATIGDRVAVLVESYSDPIWIITPDQESHHDKANRHFLALMADAIAYWLWQFTPSLGEWFEDALGWPGNVFVVVISTDARLDEDPSAIEGDTDVVPFDVELIDGDSAGLKVTFHQASIALLEGANNNGEKLILSSILGGMSRCAVHERNPALSESQIAAIIGAHAAPPLKKKLILSRAELDPELDPRGIPSRRTVDPCDEDPMLDELGTHLTSELGSSCGVIPDHERSQVLNSVTAWYYARLQRIVETLSPDGLIEWLVGHNESLLKERASGRLTLATRLACFKTRDSLCSRWAKEYSSLCASLVASRFIIEYVAARPPRGLRPISNSVYDRLLAIGSQIVQVGFQSDIVYFDLCRATVSILPSGRLGRDFDDYESASRAFMADYIDAHVTAASDRFTSRWEKPIPREAHGEMDDLSEGARVEFGRSLFELAEFWAAAGVVASEHSPVACRLQSDTFVLQLARKLQWQEEDVAKLVEDLSLRERDDFLVPPSPYERTDVYPWRFTRSYSYLRRPFLLVQGCDSFDVVTGHRHLRHSWRYLYQLCVGGRLDARSDRMKKVMSRMANDGAEGFNNKVADVLEALGTTLVRRRVKKTAQLRGELAPPGDIDVLAVSRSRRTVFLIECKDLALARTPREMANELDALVRGSRTHKSTVAKHVSRKRWAERNLEALVRDFGLGYSKKWKVEAMIVLDRRPMTARLTDSPIPILGLPDLLEFMKS